MTDPRPYKDSSSGELPPEEKIENTKIDLLKFDYGNLHTSMWENHKISWVVSGIMIPVIFTLEGLFLKSYFEKEEFTISWQYIFIFVIGTVIIQSLTVIWWLIMNAFHYINEKRINRLVKIEKIFCNRKDLLKDCKLVDQYYCVYRDQHEYNACEKENSKVSNAWDSLRFVPMGLTYSMLTDHYKCTRQKVKDLNLDKIMGIYSLVVLIPFSLNFIILIYLIIWMISISIQVKTGINSSLPTIMKI